VLAADDRVEVDCRGDATQPGRVEDPDRTLLAAERADDLEEIEPGRRRDDRAPGASAMWSAISPDLPVRGPPTRSVTSSIGL